MTPELRARVEQVRVARLATVEPNGRPHLVPLCFVLEGDVIYSAVDEKPKRSKRLKRLANIRANPEVCVLVDHYEEDWSRLWWVRVDGPAEVVDDEDAIDALAAKYAQYRAARPGGPVIAITPERWRSWVPSGT